MQIVSCLLCSIVLIAAGLHISKSLVNIIFWAISSSSCEQSISISHQRTSKSLKSPQPKFLRWFLQFRQRTHRIFDKAKVKIEPSLFKNQNSVRSAIEK